MAGNTRGKLKEHFEGIHRNFDWVLFHTNKALALVQEKHKPLEKGTKALGEAVQALDKLAQGIYGKI